MSQRRMETLTCSRPNETPSAYGTPRKISSSGKYQQLGDSVSPISYEAPCTVHFLNADNRLGLRLTDPSTTNSAIIAVTTENKLYIGFKVNGEWLTKLL